MIKNLARILHILFFIFMVSGILWIPFYILLIIFLLLRVQDAVWGGCVLTKIEYGSFERQWMESYWIKKTGIRIKYWTLIIDWLLPGIIVLLAFLFQNS